LDLVNGYPFKKGNVIETLLVILISPEGNQIEIGNSKEQAEAAK
jgi:hypothetical protein